MGETVVVTGVGMITPLGSTAEENRLAWTEGLAAGSKPVPELEETSFAPARFNPLPDFSPASRLGGRKMLKFMSDSAVLGCVAAHEAVAQSGIRDRYVPERIGLFAGIGLASADLTTVNRMIEASVDEDGLLSMERFGAEGLRSTNPLMSFKILPNMPACLISIIECIRGPNMILTPWEHQTVAVLNEGIRAVASGWVDCAVVGASDTPAHPAVHLYLRQSGHLAECEIAASAAAYLVLERETEAGDRSMSTISDPVERARDVDRRIGRCFSAAPAVMMGLRALGCEVAS